MQILAYISLTLLILTVGVQNKWEKEFEKEGITVYTKLIKGSDFKAFKGEMIIESSIDDLVSIILDVEHYPDWVYRTSKVDLIKSEQNKIFYRLISAAPFIVSDREAYTCSELSGDNETTMVTMKIFESAELVPKGFVRIPFSDGFWKFTAIDGNKTFVTFQMHAEPGGSIPAWLANLASTESPYNTLNNLRKIVNNWSH